MKKFLLIFSLLFIISSNLALGAKVNATSVIPKFGQINICDDEAEWPPYTYFERDQRGNKTKNIVGFSVDFIKTTMEKYKINYNLVMMPWKNCLQYVKDNKDQFSIILQLSKNPQREKNYIFSKAFYFTTGTLFYNKKTINIERDMANIKKFKGCGIAGYNYKTYGFNRNELDQSSISIQQLIAKINSNHCDFFIDQLEIAAGFEKMGVAQLLHNPNIGYKIFNATQKTAYYIGVSRKFPLANAIVDLLNNEISEMENNGTRNMLTEKWIH